MRKNTCVISAAYAIAELVKNLYHGLPDKKYTSLGVIELKLGNFGWKYL